MGYTGVYRIISGYVGLSGVHRVMSGYIMICKVLERHVRGSASAANALSSRATKKRSLSKQSLGS